MNTILVLIFLAQLAYSLMSTLKLYAAINDTAITYAGLAAISNAFKLSVLAGVSVEAVAGNYVALVSAVFGGMVGNIIAHHLRKRKQTVKKPKLMFGYQPEKHEENFTANPPKNPSNWKPHHW